MSVRYPASEFHISAHYTDNKYNKTAARKLLSSKDHYVTPYKRIQKY